MNTHLLLITTHSLTASIATLKRILESRIYTLRSTTISLNRIVRSHAITILVISLPIEVVCKLILSKRVTALLNARAEIKTGRGVAHCVMLIIVLLIVLIISMVVAIFVIITTTLSTLFLTHSIN